jgi:hypothetical protein
MKKMRLRELHDETAETPDLLVGGFPFRVAMRMSTVS